MLLPEEVITALRERGEIWETAPGLIGLRGSARSLMETIAFSLAELANDETSDEWSVPSGISFATLERAQYFASFPQWLTAASHLSDDSSVLEAIAGSDSPGSSARAAMQKPDAALSPAVCYHTYERLAGQSVASPTLMTAEGVCWRHEGDRLAPLERGWAFRMREVVCIGTPVEVEEFRQRWMVRTEAFAESLGLSVETVQATDPFFAPTARGKAVLQRIKALKHELTVRFPDGRSLAIASFNNHERFFGEAFEISLESGEVAASACVAFGIERWLLAVVAANGVGSEDNATEFGWSPTTLDTIGAVLQ
ncbi:MAG: aminoacyl--tRNA ligase-related protein [Gemmatimonadaceae bacterium]